MQIMQRKCVSLPIDLDITQLFILRLINKQKYLMPIIHGSVDFHKHKLFPSHCNL